VNAGHPPPFVVSADGLARRLGDGRDVGNAPLGLDSDERIQVGSDHLGAGQLLALYSDGLTEMADAGGAMLGLDGLAAVLGRAFRGGGEMDGTGAAGVARGLGEALERRQAGRPPTDDVSFLLARRL
jgi:serine phosphatase RsbU (regulator of sigma subunit)